MSEIYTILNFEPDILSTYSDLNILWKLQINAPKDYKSLTLELINDNIFLNNRRPYEKWIEFLNLNYIKFKNIYNSEYCKRLEIYDGLDIFYIEFFACDVKAGDYKVQVEQELTISMLYILDLKKQGIISPFALEKRIDNARQILRANHDNIGKSEKSLLKYFININKLIEHCHFYEHNIKYFLSNV